MKAFQKMGKGVGKERKGKPKEHVSYNCLPILQGRRDKGASNLVPRFNSQGRKKVWCTFLLCGEGGRERGREKSNKASYFSVINFRSYLLYVASSILSSQSLMENQQKKIIALGLIDKLKQPVCAPSTANQVVQLGIEGIIKQYNNMIPHFIAHPQ